MSSERRVLAAGAAVCLAVALGTAGRAAVPAFFPDDPIQIDDDRALDASGTKEIEGSNGYDFAEHTFFKPGDRRDIRAVNVNTMDEVPDSSWFTNRLGVRDMTIEEVLRGPDTVDGPAPGTWTIIGKPGSGITPKFTIRDANGITFIVKLDPPDAAELASSVELVGTKIFHAIGYNVPEDFVASMDPAKLVIAPGTMFKSKTGQRFMKPSSLGTWNHQVGSGFRTSTVSSLFGADRVPTADGEMRN